MPEYILRVQLKNENIRAYTLLRDNLLKIGFTKRIKDKLDNEYRLPNGNYYIKSTTDKDDIINAVKKIAFKIDTSPQIILVESKNMTWFNLEKC